MGSSLVVRIIPLLKILVFCGVDNLPISLLPHLSLTLLKMADLF